MAVIGISDGRLNSGAALIDGGRIIYAITEERITRRKQQGGFPHASIREILKIHNQKKITEIAMGGIFTPSPLLRLVRPAEFLSDPKSSAPLETIKDFIEHDSGLTSMKAKRWMLPVLFPALSALIRKDLPSALSGIPIRFFDHHLCHVASAYFTSGKSKALAVTCDGTGDGVFLTVSMCEGISIRKIHEVRCRASLGQFYSLVTSYLGLRPHRHEGKVTGLAAHGDPGAVKAAFPVCSRYRYGFGRRGYANLSRILSGHKKEDIAAWLQHHTEQEMVRHVKPLIRKTGIRDLVLAGGVFANVRLNQRLFEIEGVKSIYVFPQMDDGGLAAGAALLCSPSVPSLLEDAFLGTGYTETEIENAVSGLRYIRPKNMAKRIATLLAAGKVVCRFDGRMEYGPRALGNRSILYQPTDKSVNDWLNKRLRRTEYMPFAPAVIEDHAKKCFLDISGAEVAARFMTITFECTPWMKKKCPGVVHVDGTARPQLVNRGQRGFFSIIDEYRKLTGIPALINTSFNMHEEPIVRSPEDAVRAFKESGLDYLAIGPFLVR